MSASGGQKSEVTTRHDEVRLTPKPDIDSRIYGYTPLVRITRLMRNPALTWRVTSGFTLCNKKHISLYFM
jgi:hypothetical protein